MCRSLGAVLYELCTLERAFPGPNMMAVMYNIVTGDQPELPADFNPCLRILLSMYVCGLMNNEYNYNYDNV